MNNDKCQTRQHYFSLTIYCSNREGFKNLEWKDAEIKMNGKYLINLKFANYIVLMSKSTKELQQISILQLNSVVCSRSLCY